MGEGTEWSILNKPNILGLLSDIKKTFVDLPIPAR